MYWQYNRLCRTTYPQHKLLELLSKLIILMYLRYVNI
nr:MAG TPA: hypothetical protein [Caudoviricetes sp.]